MIGLGDLALCLEELVDDADDVCWFRAGFFDFDVVAVADDDEDDT